jgi:hypothetical protein
MSAALQHPGSKVSEQLRRAGLSLSGSLEKLHRAANAPFKPDFCNKIGPKPTSS